MNIKKAIKAVIATTALAIVGVGAPVVATSSGSASTASAAVTPVIYNYASGWNNPTVCVTTRGRIPGCPALVRE